MVSWFESAMEESEKYIEAMSDCIPEIKEKSKPMSKADKIRSMTNKEMSTDLIPLIMEVCEDGVPSEELFLEWLQSEAE